MSHRDHPFPGHYIALACVAALNFIVPGTTVAQQVKTIPIFADGQAQIVPGFRDSTQWIRQELWVETEFDSDGDGRRDRMHVDVTRPGQTGTEGLKVPVIYESSPYYAGIAEFHNWNVEHELGALPSARQPSRA